MNSDSHLSEAELLLACDGELPIDRAAHVSKCAACRARKQEMEEAAGAIARLHREVFDPLLPGAAGPSARLQARLASLSPAPEPRWHFPASGLRAMAAVLVIAIAATVLYSRVSHRAAPPVPVTLPEPSLTPGAVATADPNQICAAPRPKNRAVPASLARRVFAEYGMPDAKPQAYEVDYLITPALGGADDIRNLWPQSNADAVWNSRVKDALEDRLHELVCMGNLDLVAAQRDLSSDWIAAYKKYFGTDQPLRPGP